MSALLGSATSLFALLPDAAFIIDTKGSIQHWNPAATRLYGWPVDQALHRDSAEIAPLPAPLPTITADGLTATHQHRDGSALAVHISVQALVDDVGAPSGTLALVRSASAPVRPVINAPVDLTSAPAGGRAPAPAAALQPPDLAALTSLLGQAPVGISLLDTKLRFQYINDTLAAINGRPAAAHLGRTMHEILPQLAPAIEPFYRQVLTSGEPLRDVEVVGSTPADLQETRTWSASFYPVTDATGTCLGVGAIVRDVTVERRLAQQLQMSEARYRMLFDTMAQGVIVYDADARATLANPAAAHILGLTQDQMIGSSALSPTWSIVREDGVRVSAAEHPIVTGLQSGQTVSDLVLELIPPAEASTRWLRIQVVPSGHLGITPATQVAVFFEDITATRRAEHALRASQQQLQHLIDNTDGVLWSMDAEFRLLVGNQRFHEQVRAVSGQAIAAGDSLLLPSLPADLLAERRQIYGRALAGETFTIERLSRVADPPRMLEEHYRPIRATDGTITGVTVFMRDVTEPRRLAQERQNLERKLATVLDLLPVGVAILNADSAVVYTNPAQRRIARLDQERLENPWQATRQYLRPDGTSRPLEEFATIRALRERQLVADVDTGIVTETGECIWTRVSATPVELADWRVVAVMRDITEQHQAYQTLQHERVQLAVILNTMHEGLIAAAPDGRIILMNPAAVRTRGLDPAQPLTQLRELAQTGHQLLDTSGRRIPLPDLPLHRVLRGERFASVELCQRSPDGQEQWHLVNGTPVFDDTGALTLAVITSKDITERKHATAALAAHADALSRTNAELTRALTLKDEFLAMITHELRTPLQVVLGYTEALADQLDGALTARQQQMLARIERSGKHLLGILSDMLDLTRLNAGSVRLTPEALDVDLVCLAALQYVHQRAREQGITLLRSVAVGVEQVRADERRLTQILVNLLDNAVKFTPAGGRVGLEVTADEAREQIHFTVWDTGIGIAKGDMGRLFQPFTQVDGRLSRAYEGIGLGLTLVRRLVELHGGSVTLTSEPEQGSRFTVTLPWTASDNERAPNPDTAPQAPSWRQAPHVLVVDDDEATVALYAEYLVTLGCHVTTARTGMEALTRVREQLPNIMVLDIRLPELDGIGVLERLRDEPATMALPVLAVTALAMPDDREHALVAGATAYLAKPISLRTLVETIGQLWRDGTRGEP